MVFGLFYFFCSYWGATNLSGAFLAPTFVSDLERLRGEILQGKSLHEQKAVVLGQEKGRNEAKIALIDRVLSSGVANDSQRRDRETKKADLERQNAQLASDIQRSEDKGRRISDLLGMVDQAMPDARSYEEKLRELVSLDTRNKQIRQEIRALQDNPNSLPELARLYQEEERIGPRISPAAIRNGGIERTGKVDRVNAMIGRHLSAI